MLCIVAIITAIGVLLILVKTIIQALHHPVEVSDLEDPVGITVWVHIVLYTLVGSL